LVLEQPEKELVAGDHNGGIWLDRRSTQHPMGKGKRLRKRGSGLARWKRPQNLANQSPTDQA
jgi:hypothetical protein